MTDRVAGALLFLPVPVVLWLFTGAPLGHTASIVTGVLLMATHRLYARPFALRRADRRCLWCGSRVTVGRAIVIDEPSGRTAWRACGAAHEDRLRRFLGAASRWGFTLRLGILGSLAVFLVAAVLAALGLLGPMGHGDAVAFFKLAVGVTVLPLGWLAPFSMAPPAGALRVPLPVHIQALLGSWSVVWLFRVVGVVWLVQGVWHVAARLR